jgi:hypothetical protein
MNQKTKLGAALKELSGIKTQPKDTKPPRLGKKMIAAYYDSAVNAQLRHLAIEQNTNMQNLLGEAINDLFVKYGKSPIAEVQKC